MGLCGQSNVSASQYVVYVCHSFSSKEQASFNFMAAVIVCSNFGAQENKVCHHVHFFSSHEAVGPDAMILVLGTFSFKPAFKVILYLVSLNYH